MNLRLKIAHIVRSGMSCGEPCQTASNICRSTLDKIGRIMAERDSGAVHRLAVWNKEWMFDPLSTDADNQFVQFTVLRHKGFLLDECQLYVLGRYNREGP